jgi:hypothetical protein
MRPAYKNGKKIASCFYTACHPKRMCEGWWVILDDYRTQLRPAGFVGQANNFLALQSLAKNIKEFKDRLPIL